MPSNEEALQAMPTEYVVCRMLRHNWNFIGFYNANGPNGRKFTAMALECNLCGMTRDDYLDAHGHLASRHYEPPEDYSIKRAPGEKREGRVQVSESRAEMMGRSTVYQSASNLERATKRAQSG